MSLWRAAIMGIVQGATEFLPISSSGHLVLVPWLLGWEDPGLSFDVVAHLGTLAALVGYYWEDLVRIGVGWLRGVVALRPMSREARMGWLLVVSAIPAGVVGLLLEEPISWLFGSPRIVSLLLIVTGLILYGVEQLRHRSMRLEDLGVGDALIVGLAQCLAIAPGISRSGSTIAGGLLRGVERSEAARFAMLMSVPVIMGAGVAQGYRMVSAPASAPSWDALTIGFVFAALSGWVGIRLLLAAVRRRGLRPFAYYCWAFGATCFSLSLVVA